MTPISTPGWQTMPGAPEGDALAPLSDGGALRVVAAPAAEAGAAQHRGVAPDVLW